MRWGWQVSWIFILGDGKKVITDDEEKVAKKLRYWLR